jgi:hypothetical protein
MIDKERESFSAKCSELEEKLPEYINHKIDDNFKIRHCSFDKDDSKDECSANCLFEKTNSPSEEVSDL